MGILAEAMRMRFSRDVVSLNAVTFSGAGGRVDSVADIAKTTLTAR
jgi:hypothetical protein